MLNIQRMRDGTCRLPDFTAVTRVQIPSGTPNIFSSLRFDPLLFIGTKRHKSRRQGEATSLKRLYFRTDRAASSRHKLGTHPSRFVPTRSGWRRLKKTNYTALCSSFLYCDCLGIRIRRDPTRSMTKQFLRYFDVRFVGSQ